MLTGPLGYSERIGEWWRTIAPVIGMCANVHSESREFIVGVLPMKRARQLMIGEDASKDCVQ